MSEEQDSKDTMLYSAVDPPESVVEPNYSILAAWFDAWPEARPALLDFWARGGYMQRLLWRAQTRKPAVSVSVRYLDEAEWVLRRLALLGVDVDILWCGDVTPPSLVIAPQETSYEGVGGWGYTACGGSQFNDRRGGLEWCPTLAWAELLPDTITDWLSTDAAEFFNAGSLFVAPSGSVGIPRRVSGPPIENPHFTETTQIRALRKQIQLLSAVKLPVLDGMGLPDIHKFCVDHSEELRRYRKSVAKLLVQEGKEQALQDVQREIEDSVSELTSSGKRKGMRRLLAAAGGVLATANLVIAVNAGMDYAELALTVAGGGVAAAKWWQGRLSLGRERRRNPYWLLWKLAGRRTRSIEFRADTILDSSTSSARKAPPSTPRHWLAPPSPGWHQPLLYIGDDQQTAD